MHARRMNRWRTTTGLALCATAAIGVGASTASAAEGKVDLCHATSSGTNPYSLQSPSASSVVSPAGHGSHPNDVIPPIPSLGYPGQNWAAGADTLVGAECFALEITKTGDAQAVLGDTIEYDITVKNIGFLTIPYANINVVDPGATLIPPTDKTALLPGASRIWAATRKATAADCGGDLINTATVNFTGDKMVKSDQWATSISCPGDLSITKTGPKEIAPGDVVDYTIAVKNNGTQPVPTTVIKVTDPGATLTPPGSMPDALAVGQTLTWTAKKTPTDTGCGVEVANTATVAFADGSGWTEAAASNNSSTWKSLIVCPVDLTIKKTGDVEILPGGVIKYSIAVTNNGKYDIPIGSVEVSDAAADAGSLTPAEADLKVLAAGGTAMWTATLTTAKTEEICNTKVENTATVGLKATPGFSETDTENNSSTMFTQVICPLKVSIAKDATNGPLEPGEVATYDVIVTNTGDFTVPFDQIVVSDPGADLTAPTDTSPLAPGDKRPWKATRTVPADQACGSKVENTAEVSLGKPSDIAADAGDAVPSDQTATAYTSIVCPIDLTIEKTGDVTVLPGGVIKYSVTVTNKGKYDIPFASVEVTDPDADSGSLTPPDPAPKVLAANGGTAIWTATQTAAESEEICNTKVENTATVGLKVTEGFTEPDATNNSSTFLTQVICPLKVSIAKNATNGPLEPGQLATYEVIVTNSGDFTVPFDQIVVSDPGADLTDPEDTSPLAPGKTRTWTATRKVPADQACGSQVENTAGVTLGKPDTIAAVADDAVAEPQTATAFTSIICPVSVSITKSTPQASVTPGGTVAYDVTVTNPSPYPVPFSSIVVTDEGATLTPPADASDLAPGATRTWTATKAVASDAALCGTGVTNTATAVLGELPEGLKSTLEGPVSATATPVTVAGGICVPVTPATVEAFRPAAGPTLTVAKTGPARALAGGRVAYRITVTNTGGTDATGVVLRDQPPNAFALIRVPSGGRLQGTNVLWDIGTVGVGQSVTKTIRFTARRTASGRKCNIALVSATGLESVRARACTVVVAAKRPVTPVTG